MGEAGGGGARSPVLKVRRQEDGHSRNREGFGFRFVGNMELSALQLIKLPKEID